MKFMSAASCLAGKAHGVRIVNHYQRFVLISQFADRGEIGNETIHREDTIGGDHAVSRRG